jgi:hypothetical protein
MKKLIISIMTVLSISLGVSAVAFAAGPTDSAKADVCNSITTQTGGTCAGGAADINRIVRAALQILTWVAGIAAIIMVIVAGLKYITSGGDSSSVASAKNSLIYAIVGLIIVALAQFIVRFFLSKAAK